MRDERGARARARLRASARSAPRPPNQAPSLPRARRDARFLLAGRVWRIDTGVSRGIAGGRPEALEVRDDGRVRVLLEHCAPVDAAEREAR